jgi:Protein of unknown function (DUF1194)
MRRRDFIRGAALAPTALAAAAAGTAAAGRPARAFGGGGPEPVDLELVLAVDASSSINADEMELQLRGYAAAFRSASLIRQVASGPVGAIACTLFTWADPDHQQVLVPWMRIDGAGAAEGFAAAVDAAPRVTGLYTSISAAIDFAANLFGRGGFEGSRRVVDISGDGVDNAARPGRLLAHARDEALDRGIVLNGLAILDSEPSTPPPPVLGSRAGGRAPLDEYYREVVIGGPGCFLVVAEGFEAFGPAVRRKLAREIACAPPPAGEQPVERFAASGRRRPPPAEDGKEATWPT